ncbi:MAG: hypothetical protein GX815_09580 [Clostridiales bacterium]|jgi:hypothetical protein|nr:hypothetical protein [Clostridiales bacterium]
MLRHGETITLQFHVKDANNKNLISYGSGEFSFSDTVGKWNTISITGIVPAEVNGVEVK